MILIASRENENLLAVMGCRSNGIITSAQKFAEALSNAVTKWIDETNEGKEVLAKNLDGTFNFGDLYISISQRLMSYMAFEGIYDFTIQLIEGTEPNVSFDMNLKNKFGQ